MGQSDRNTRNWIVVLLMICGFWVLGGLICACLAPGLMRESAEREKKEARHSKAANQDFFDFVLSCRRAEALREADFWVARSGRLAESAELHKYTLHYQKIADRKRKAFSVKNNRSPAEWVRDGDCAVNFPTVLNHHEIAEVHRECERYFQARQTEEAIRGLPGFVETILAASANESDIEFQKIAIDFHR